MLNEFEKQIDEIMSYGSNKSDFNEIINLINNQKNYWELCRFDLRNNGNEFNRINILENPNNSYINFPSWFRDHNGQGCQIQCQVNKLNLKFQCVNDGELKIYLRGIDYRNFEHKRSPIYVNFTIFKLNNRLIFDEDKLLWHDKPYEFEILSTDKEIFDIYLEFKTIFDYYPFFLNFFNNVKNMDELNEEYYKFKKQIEFIRFLEHYYEFNNSSLEMYDFMNKYNELSLGGNEKNLFSYDSFLNYYDVYLNYLELKNHIDQLNAKIEFLENRISDYENNIFK